MELFDTRLNADDKPMTAAELVEAVKTADVLVPTVTDRIDSRVLSPGRAATEADRLVRHRRRPHRSRHRPPARHHRHQHAGRADRGHRRHDDGAGAAPPRAAWARASAWCAPANGPAGARPRCWAAGCSASAWASSAWAASARRWRRRARGFGLSIHYHNRKRVHAEIETRARGDLLGKPRPDAGAHGHRLGQLPAHAGDLPSAVGAAAEADEADRHHRQHRARRGDRRERDGAHAEGGRARRRRASTSTSTSRRSIPSCSSSTTSCCCRTWARPRSRAASRWARRC